MVPTRLGRAVAYAATFALLGACAEVTQTPLVPDDAAAFGKIPTNPSPNLGVADIEFFEVCKQYVGQVGPAVTVDVAVSGTSAPTNFQVTLADGECKDVWLHGGTADQVTVTEQVPANYSASYVREVVTRTGYTVDPVAAGNSASGNVSGNPGEGTLVRFINTFVPPPPPPSCTLTQGYWKNHQSDWDDAGDNRPFLTTDLFYNSGVSYITIMNTAPKGGNAYIQLAHQFIAASLNVGGLSGSGVAAVDAALAGADAYFAGAAAGIPNPSGSLRTQLQGWATTLDDYNNGVTGPGHCTD